MYNEICIYVYVKFSNIIEQCKKIPYYIAILEISLFILLFLAIFISYIDAILHPQRMAELKKQLKEALDQYYALDNSE